MRNWAGNLAYAARALHEPTSLEQLQELVRVTPRIRALGTRHSFSGVADTQGELVSLARMPRRFEVDATNRRVCLIDTSGASVGGDCWDCPDSYYSAACRAWTGGELTDDFAVVVVKRSPLSEDPAA